MARYEVVYPRKWIYTGVKFPEADHLPYAAVHFSDQGEWLRIHYFDTKEELDTFMQLHDSCDCRGCRERCTAKWKNDRYAPEHGGKGKCLLLQGACGLKKGEEI